MEASLRAGSGQSHSAAKHWGSSLLMKSLLRALSSFTHFKIAEMKPEAKQQAFCLDKECPLEGAATLTCTQSSFWQCLFSLRLPLRAPLVAAAPLQQSEMETTSCCSSGLHQPSDLPWVSWLSLRWMLCLICLGVLTQPGSPGMEQDSTEMGILCVHCSPKTVRREY